MDIFSANPSSFKMDKNSSFASQLKASVAEKLTQFLVNYTDDVLAEYIVVLVCHGKDQNQAKEDLEAFLGERSGEFVSWLWDFLLNSVDHAGIPMGPSYLNGISINGCDTAVKNKRKRFMSKDLHNHVREDANLLSNNEKGYFPSTYDAHQLVSSSGNEVCKDSQCCSPGFDIPLNKISNTEGQTQTFRHYNSENSVPTEDRRSEVLTYKPSRVKVLSGISAGDEERMPYVSEDKQLHIVEQKVSKHSDGLPPQHPYLPKKELGPSNLESVTIEKPKYGPLAVAVVAGRRSSPRPVDTVSHENARPRGSVWDRLGRPRNDNITASGKNTESHGIDVVKRKIVENPLNAHNKKRLTCVPGGGLNRGLPGEIIASGKSYGPVISNTNCDQYRRSEHDHYDMYLPEHADKSNRKRQFSKIVNDPSNGPVSLGESNYTHLQDKEAHRMFQRAISAKYSCYESLRSISSGNRQEERPPTCQAIQLPVSSFLINASTVSRRKFGGEALELTHHVVSNNLSTKSGPARNANTVKTNLKPAQAQMLDMKLRLHQIEKEMTKLRAKQQENYEGKTDLLPSSGALNHSDDDVESRTVFVTNVHFAATGEALSSHFAKCGMLVKVITGNDIATAQPKGTACITFAHTESADKAVALNGTSFWSRTLKVVKKTEMPVATSASPQPAGKPSQPVPLPLQVNGRVLFPRPYAGSLQWRRDQPVPTEHSVVTPGDGLEASATPAHNDSLANTVSAVAAVEYCTEAPEEEKCKEARADEECKEET